MKTFSPLATFLVGLVALLVLATWLARPVSDVPASSQNPAVASASPAGHAWLAEAFPVAQAGFVKSSVARS